MELLPGFLGMIIAVCALGPPVLLTLRFRKLKKDHPTIPNGECVHTLKETRAGFKKMARSLLVHEYPTDHKHNVKFKEWLDIKTINANNYCDDDKVDCDTEEKDGRCIETVEFNVTALMSEVVEDSENQNGQQDQDAAAHVTPMMEIINYHLLIIFTASRLEQNFGMKISEFTQLKRDRLHWRGAIDFIRTLEERPTFPSVLKHALVRDLKTTEWDYAGKGTRLDPQTLSEKPWPGLESTACAYIDSVIEDIWRHWFWTMRVPVLVPVLGIILGSFSFNK